MSAYILILWNLIFKAYLRSIKSFIFSDSISIYQGVAKNKRRYVSGYQEDISRIDKKSYYYSGRSRSVIFGGYKIDSWDRAKRLLFSSCGFCFVLRHSSILLTPS